MGQYRVSMIGFCMAFFLIVSACGGAEGEAQNTSSPGSAVQPSVSASAIVYIGTSGAPDTLNPANSFFYETTIVSRLVYDTMYYLDLEDATIKPLLAEQVEVSEDGKVWTFTLYEGIEFHDGEPLTAEDVVFSYNLYRNSPTLQNRTAAFDSVEASDERTVVLTLTKAVPNIENELRWLYILPKHIWSEVEDLTEFKNEEMIGSGPFRLVEHQPGTLVRLGANPNHFRSPPRIDEVVFESFDSQDALVQALRAGTVDVVLEIPPDVGESLKSVANIDLVIGPRPEPRIRSIIINQIPPERCPAEGGICSGHPALQDRKVRQALAYATDKKRLLQEAESGYGEVGLTHVAASMGNWFNTEIEDYAFDIKEANRMLDEAGYDDTNEDDIREMPGGDEPLEFRLNWPDELDAAHRMSYILAEDWSKIGITLDPKEVPSEELLPQSYPGYDFDVLIWGWNADIDSNEVLNLMVSQEIATGLNETGYVNSEYDELFKKQAAEVDPEARRKLVWQMQQIVHRDVVYIIPYYEYGIQGYRNDRFTGFPDSELVALQDRQILTHIRPRD